jgi:hypothetical protein
MPDLISLMLDSMITAVDDGFSYDGIVSMPEIGLEDARYRLDDDLVRPLLCLPTAITNDGSCDSGAISNHGSDS